MLPNSPIMIDSAMDRRKFLGVAAVGSALSTFSPKSLFASPAPAALKPFEIGLLIVPFGAAEEKFRVLRDLGLSNCFLSLDGYIGGFTPAVIAQFKELTAKYNITVTTVEVVRPEPLEWNFLKGPSTIGLVPPKYRAARMDALRQVSDFAKALGVEQVQTHCGFIPEDPADALYPEAVEAIKKVAQHCHENGQYFLMETGQETPTTMSRMIRDVAMPNLAVGLDTANLILYGKANPVDAVDILGPHIRSIHAKDGKWPTNPSELGEEVKIGEGLVNFREVFTKLHKVGYKGVVTIERETSGPQQIEDVRDEKIYLEKILHQVVSA